MQWTEGSGEPEAGGADLVFVARQPIVNRAGRMIAYELLFRSGPASFARIGDDFRCTAEVVENAMGSMGLSTLLGELVGYLNCSADFLHSSIPDILPTHRVVLEILETCELDEKLKRRCNALRAAGFRVALDDVRELGPAIESFLPVVDVVKLEWPAIASERRRALVSQLKRAGKLVLAEKVEERDEWRTAIDAGCDFVQGFYFSRPQLVESRRTVPALGGVLEILTLLIDEASDQSIVRALSKAPLLVAQLLRVAKGSAISRAKHAGIVSLHHALAMVGTSRLFHWCCLLLYNHPDGLPATSDPLAALATQRAGFMSHAALLLHRGASSFAQTAYLTGMLSLLHVAYAQDQKRFTGELALATSITEALLNRSGELGRLLGAAERFEKGLVPIV